jgi:hypothetical protein
VSPKTKKKRCFRPCIPLRICLRNLSGGLKTTLARNATFRSHYFIILLGDKDWIDAGSQERLKVE